MEGDDGGEGLGLRLGLGKSFFASLRPGVFAFSFSGQGSYIDAMKTWTLTGAKNHFSEVAELATKKGPQKVTRNGKAPVVVISLEDLEMLTPEPPDDVFRPEPDVEKVIEQLLARKSNG
jgi:prevent-host-death family protein